MHKMHGPEVFLRTVALIQGQHGGGMRGIMQMQRTPWDVVTPPYALGANDRIVGAEPDELPSLSEQANHLIAWMKSADEEDLDVAGVPVRSPYALKQYLPATSRYTSYVPWVGRHVARAVKIRKKVHRKMGSEEGPVYYKREGRAGPRYDPPRDYPDAFLFSARGTLEKYRPALRFPDRPWADHPVTEFDLLFAIDMHRLSENLRDIIDWVQGADGVDLGPYDVCAALNQSRIWHAEKRKLLEAAAARNNPGAVVHTWDDGWTMQSLVTKKQLVADGESMVHCVGDSDGYLHAVQHGGGAILSLRDAAGDPHVTLELGLLEPDEEDEGIYHDSAVAKPPEWGGDPKTVPFAAVVQINKGGGKQYLFMSDVLQAKGPDNAVPAVETLPYLRDYLEDTVRDDGWGEAFLAKSPRAVATGLLESEEFEDTLGWAVDGLVSTDQIRKQALKTQRTDRYDDLVRLFGAILINRGATAYDTEKYRPWNYLGQMFNAQMGGYLGDALNPEWFNEVMGPLTDHPNPATFLV